MNVFFVIGDTAVTPDLSGTNLPCITRDCVITLLKSMSIPVAERSVY
jgi:branched-chain amino acid aminotransferase